jgi:hypothetical protein
MTGGLDDIISPDENKNDGGRDADKGSIYRRLLNYVSKSRRAKLGLSALLGGVEAGTDLQIGLTSGKYLLSKMVPDSQHVYNIVYGHIFTGPVGVVVYGAFFGLEVGLNYVEIYATLKLINRIVRYFDKRKIKSSGNSDYGATPC